MPDVAYLDLDISQYQSKFNGEYPPPLVVSKIILRDIGSEVAIIGYPSPNYLMIDPKTNKPKNMEPIVQFAKLAGVLPFSKASLPALLAFDTVIAKGSSGSPIVDIGTGEVVAIAAQLLPFQMPTFTDQGVFQTIVPAAVGFGVPSNFFYELSKSSTGDGKFNFNENELQ